MSEFVEWAETEESVAARFEAMAAAYAGRPAVVGAEGALTYAELNAAANRLARAVRARAGDAAQPVAVVLEHGVGVVVGLLAVLKAGHFYAALEPAMPEDKLRAVLADMNPPVVVTSRKHAALAQRAAPAGAAVLAVEDGPADAPADNLGLALSPDDYLNLSYTSGTSGQPKGVLQSQASLLNTVRLGHTLFRITPDDRLALLQSASFGGSISNLFGALLAGAALYPYNVRRLGTAGLAAWLRDHAITIYHSVPTIFRRMLTEAPPGLDLPHLRVVKLGGEAVTRRDVELFDAHCPATSVLRVGLGSTEAYLVTAYLYQRGLAFDGNITPVGAPEPGVEVWLAAEDGQRIDPDRPGQVGEVIACSRYLSPGYWRRPAETAERFGPDQAGGDRRVLRTGDLGLWLPDGHLQHLGRKDERVKVRGQWVDLSEVEAALLQLDGVREAAATVQTEPSGETRLAAYYVGEAAVAGALRAALAERLPLAQVPDDLLRLEALPVLPFGKVDRRALPPITAADRERQRAAPRTPTERQLAAVWGPLLKRENVGVLDNFFDLGGDSLVAIQLQQQVETVFGVKLELRELFEAGSLDQMARLIETRAQAAPAAGPAALTPEELATALRRLGVG